MNSSCPFCGSYNVIIDTLNYTSGKPGKFRAQCQNCDVTTGWKDTEEAARSAWNMRLAQSPVSSLFNKDLFFYKGALYARNPQNGFCFISDKDGYKRIRKADYLLAYAECAKAAGKITA